MRHHGLVGLLFVTLGITHAHADKPSTLGFDIKIEQSEHSKDSHSTTTHEALKAADLTYDETTTGHHGGPPIHETATLDASAVAALATQVRKGKLTADATIKLAPATTPGTDVKVTATIELDGKTAKIELSGAYNLVTKEPLFAELSMLVATGRTTAKKK